MRTLVALLFVAAALTVTGVALSSGSPNDRLASQVRVYGGGQFTSPFGPRSFALDAHVEGHGSGAAYGTWEYGPTNGPWHIKGEVTCVAVAGTTAIVGGYVTQSERPELVGLAFAAYVRDNGAMGTGAVDQASIGWFGTPDGVDGDFPTTFPQTCPATASFGPDVAPAIWGDVQGDVVVQP